MRSPRLTSKPLCITTEFAGLGVSLIDSRPRELLYAVCQDFAAEYLESRTENRFSMVLRRLEIDNQSIDTEYPVLLEPQRLLSIDGTIATTGKGIGSAGVRRDRVVEFTLSIAPPGSAPSSSGVHYVKYCVLKVDPLDLAVDLRILESLMSLGSRVTEMVEASTAKNALQVLPARTPSEAILRTDSRSPDDDNLSTTSSGRWTSPGARNGRFVHAGLRVSSGTSVSEGRMEQPETSGFDTLEDLVTSQPDLPWYFERLVIRPTAIRLSLSSSSLGLTPLAYIADIQAAQLRFEAVRLNDVLLPLPELTDRLVSHYRRAIISNVFNVLLSSRFLIAPKTLVEAVGSGLSDFLNESIRSAADVRTFI
jgi:Vacuolar-sorting-associated 13 protein C-terminal